MQHMGHDSDTVAAIAVGFAKIPNKYTAKLLLGLELLGLAEELSRLRGKDI